MSTIKTIPVKTWQFINTCNRNPRIWFFDRK